MPIYEGEIPTQLRAALYIDGHGKKANIIYSPIFKGSINPGQFWRKLSYHYLATLKKMAQLTELCYFR